LESENDLKFEFFKGYTVHFLPLYGDDITIEQATQMSKCGGGCGGPFWPVRRSSTDKTMRFELEAKRIASKFRAEFSVINALSSHAQWWKKNTIYMKWLGMKADIKQRKYKIKHKPALVVRLGDKSTVFYDLAELEKKVRDFVATAKYSNS
jgi:hypothetical protein